MTKHQSQQQDAELTRFLPMTREEMAARGWDELDVLLVCGDAYVDHPSFGMAVIGRWLESKGFRVGIISQPDWRDAKSVEALGRPRLFAGIAPGAVDSMLNLFTANKKRRSEDDYSPGGKNDKRPPRTTIVYANLIRQAFPDLPIIIGGVEASLRRLIHYDYWEDRIRTSILVDSGADLLVYGMGERAVLEAARRLQSGAKQGMKYISGTVFLGAEKDLPGEERTIRLPSRQDIERSPAKLVEATKLSMDHVNPATKNWLAQYDGDRLIIETPPQRPLSKDEMDEVYSLPYTRRQHFSYKEPVPALETVKFSITVHRGCYGGCTFCGLGLHQGKVIQSRSVESVTGEIERLSKMHDWKGTITDLGGPTANMYGTSCGGNQAECRRTSCLFPKPCPKLKANHEPSLKMLAAVRSMPCVKRAFIASGIRHDLALLDPRYIDILARHHTGGHLSSAPEHSSPKVLNLMGKPPIELFEKFRKLFEAASRKAGKEQYVIPYLISSFPGCTDSDMAELRDYLKRSRVLTKQVQDFTPTPMTLATAMYYAGCDENGRLLKITKFPAERKRQQAYIKGEPRPARLSHKHARKPHR